MSVEVRLVDVVKTFDTAFALDSINLSVERGELFFLLGPSGCGKTTCLRTIAGFYQPDSGELFFGDHLMNNVPPHKRNTGMVFQNYALWPHMTVAENIEYGLSLRKEDKSLRREKVFSALQTIQMEDYIDRPINKLSGGEQQRVALARALVIEPDVLLLDEPLSNMDAKLRLEMRNEIKRIHSQSNITAIYVTHDQSEALSMADRMAVMKDGKIVQVGTPRHVYCSPSDTFVANFIGETNFVCGSVESHGTSETVINSEIGMFSSQMKKPFQKGEKVFCSIRPEAIQVGGLLPQGVVNQFEAKVTGITYLGRIEEYHLLVNDKIPLKATRYKPGNYSTQAGEQLTCFVAPEDVILLPPDM
ncbi:spermidine/putrescine ABC transporter ATP-binding protein [Candidatus Poribacteria bacterium]|nr:spermidine/putrescine ABC transporter ATP-binding protein [Candidatus Poribacteria bacterium]